MSVYEGHGVTLHHGDCLDVLRTLPDASVDSVCTDPPYGLEFMGKDWDAPWQESDVNADAGFHGGGISQTAGLPSFTGSSNPKCLNCRGTRRGRRDGTAKVAVCLCVDGGRFPNTRAVEMRAFGEWCEAWATECLRVLKPGGHLLAFGGTRTWHRLACAVEDAGFEVRDSIAWLYGSGFPKSLDVSKAIDKRANVNDETHRRIALVAEVIRTHREAKGMERAEVSRAVVGTPSGACWNWEHHQLPSAEMWPAIKRVLDIPDKFDGLIEGTRAQFIGAEREVIGARLVNGAEGSAGGYANGIASQRGLGGVVREIDITAPATTAAQQWDGWGTALKPAFEPVVVARKPLIGTVAATVLEHGTGALNIGACRIGLASGEDVAALNARSGGRRGFASEYVGGTDRPLPPGADLSKGRWPANVVLDESQAAALDEQSGESRDGTAVKRNRSEDGRAPYEASSYMITDRSREDQTYGGQGGASRFFYVAKADASERPRVNGTAHPTVKPLDLMRWLVRLVTPPGGTVLEPFAGSGTTVEACIIEGFQCIAIEREADYLPLIRQRIDRRRDPVEALRGQAADLGLFDLLGGEGA